MALEIINSVEKGSRTVVMLRITAPTEIRDDAPTEVVRSTDKHHRASRELMKHLGYVWCGGTFDGELWFRPLDPKMFDNGPRVCLVTYKTIIEEVKDLDRSEPAYTAIANMGLLELPVTPQNMGRGNEYDDSIRIKPEDRATTPSSTPDGVSVPEV